MHHLDSCKIQIKDLQLQIDHIYSISILILFLFFPYYRHLIDHKFFNYIFEDNLNLLDKSDPYLYLFLRINILLPVV